MLDALPVARRASPYEPGLLGSARLVLVTPLLTEIGRVAAELASWQSSYEKNGVFEPSLRDVLPFGIQSGAQRQAFVQALQSQQAELANSVDRYKTDLRRSVTDLIADLQGQGSAMC